MARFIAQLIVSGSQVVVRAFARALREEMQSNVAARAAAAESGRDGQKTVKADTFTGMSLEEAMQILHVKDLEDSDVIHKNYDHLFKVNDKASGGSFYLQSKVYRAKERVDLEVENMHRKEQEQNSKDQT